MPEYKLKARIQNKYKPLTEWNAIAAGEFVPLLGEVCYAVEDGVLLQKIGDGTTDFTKLEWLFCQAPQTDHSENDVSSPAYIKNRLGYVDMGDVPEDQQEMGHFENPNETVFETQLINLKEDVGITAEEIGLPSSITHMVQCITRYPYLFNQTSITSILKDTDDIYEITIGEPDNDYKFILETDNYIIGTVDDESYPYTAFLIGNPIGANMFLQGMEAPNLMFPTDKGTEYTYTVLLITRDSIGNEPAMASVVFLGNAAEYGANNPNNIKFSLKHIKQSTVYPIDGKFLVNAQADQFEMNMSKQSFIKNRYGDLFRYRGWHLEDNDAIFTGTYTIKKRYNDYIVFNDGECINNLPVDGLHGAGNIHYDIVSYDVEINGVLYERCPLITTSKVLVKDDEILYFIGNPSLIQKALMIDDLIAALSEGNSNPELINYPACGLEDNGLPFLLYSTDLNSARAFEEYLYGKPEWLSTLTEDTITIRVGEAQASAATHLIPDYLLPKQLLNTSWLFDQSTNAIAAKSAYLTSTSGVNSFAIGSSTRAKGTNGVAIGSSTEALGTNSFAGGSSSQAGASTSFAFGTKVTTSEANQFTIGKYNSPASAAFVIGNGTATDKLSNAFLVDWGGNAYATSIILSSPSGFKYKISVDDEGILTSIKI